MDLHDPANPKSRANHLGYISTRRFVACGLAGLVVLLLADQPSLASGFASQRIVATKTVEALPEPLSDYFATMQEALLERAVEPSGLWQRDPKFKSRAQWFYVYLDAAADSTEQSSRIVAATVFPTEQVAAGRLMRNLSIKRGGELPWAIENLTKELTQAFKSGRRDDIALRAGHLIAFCTYAADPFRVTRNSRGEESGNINFGQMEMGDEMFAHQDVAQRSGWELIRRYQHRYTGEIDVSRFNYPLGQNALQLVFNTMLTSLDDLDDYCDADRSILNKMRMKEATAFNDRKDEYYELLDGEMGEATVEMLRRGTRLAVALIYSAYTQAGSPDLSPTKSVTPTMLVTTSETEPAQHENGDSKGNGATSTESDALSTVRIASKNSKVFHLPTCTHVKRISAKNRVEYENEEAAVQSGKRRCGSCFRKSDG